MIDSGGRHALPVAIALAAAIAPPCLAGSTAGGWPPVRGCADPGSITTPLAWDLGREGVLPALLARAPSSDAACVPFVDGLVQCHLVLVQGETCPRQVTMNDLATWHVDLPTLSGLAVTNLDRLARPIELVEVLLGTGRPESVSHSSPYPTAAAWVLTPSWREKLQALHPGAWFVSLPTPGFIEAWPAGQDPSQQAMRREGADAQADYARRTGTLLSAGVFLLSSEGRLGPASPEALRSGRPDPDHSPSPRP